MSTTELLSTLQFSGVSAIFALAIYASLWTGVLSVAPVFFGAIGAFAFGYLSTTAGLTPALGLLVGIVLGAVAGVVTAVLFVRLNSHYLAMATIALVLISRVLIINLPVKVAGGVTGTLLPADLGRWSWLIGCLVLAGYVMARLARSRFGFAADAVREDPAVAQSLGISPRQIQIVGFILSGALGGMAGVMQGSFLQFIGPDTFYTDLGFVSLAAVVLGGAFNWLGPIVGAVVFTILPVLLRDPLGAYNQIVTGVILVAIIIYLPRGLVDVRWVRLLRDRARRGSRPTRPQTDVEAASTHAGAV